VSQQVAKSLMLMISLLLFFAAGSAVAATELPLLTVSEQASGATSYSVTLQVLALMTLLSLVPAGLMTMTSFTRILIVLAILRQALGTGQTPSNQIILGLALFLTLFVMAPVFEGVWIEAIQPYINDQIGIEAASTGAMQFMRDFMTQQTRASDLAMFTNLGGYEPAVSEADIPLSVLLPSFLISELKTAFQIGFLIFVPFLIIDLVVASVLMSMGMMMLSPMLISLPFKLMLFVLVDGWALVVGTLVSSFAS